MVSNIVLEQDITVKFHIDGDYLLYRSFKTPAHDARAGKEIAEYFIAQIPWNHLFHIGFYKIGQFMFRTYIIHLIAQIISENVVFPDEIQIFLIVKFQK